MSNHGGIDIARAQNVQRNLARNAKQHAEARIEQTIISTTQLIYAQLAAAHIATRDEGMDEKMNADELRAMAGQSRIAALYLAETFGMVKVATNEPVTG